VLRPRVGHLRRTAPPITSSQISGVAAILVSHAHHDHLDVPSLRSLGSSPKVLCPPAANAPVRAAGLEPTAMEPGATQRVGPLTISATEAAHDGRRWPFSRDRGAIGFVISGAAGSVYFAGDTGEFAAMADIGPVTVALLPVAGWGPHLGPGHLAPAAAARAAAAIAPRVAIPIHWGSYERVLMRTEDRGRPAREFVSALRELSPEVVSEVIEPGTAVEVEAGAGDGRAVVRSARA
jgi:L-ascorbate metabolism protein UlaG (beta-lactamase superfamily)